MSVRCSFADGSGCEVRAGETLLQACRRSAIPVPFSCGAGVCQTCLLQAIEGQVPAAAQRGLPEHLRERNYLLACQCTPDEPLVLAPPDSGHMLVEALLHEVDGGDLYLHVRLESVRILPCVAGDQVRLLLDPDGEPVLLQVTRCDEVQCLIEGLVVNGPASAWLADAAFGLPLWVGGLARAADTCELPPPATDPALWDELGPECVRRVLESFYARVYADPRLSPFFAGITMDRSIDKQFSFLRQLMTGERVYFGDRPRNAHHWMVVSGELFDYRQSIMQEELAAHGLTPIQAARWSRLELHYRSDIVKAHAWPRVVDGVALPLDGYGREVLAEATLCDHCGSGIEAGVTVDYHLRLGTVSCASCSGEGVLGNH